MAEAKKKTSGRDRTGGKVVMTLIHDPMNDGERSKEQ